MTLQEALLSIQQTRSFAKPKRNFLSQLKEFRNAVESTRIGLRDTSISVHAATGNAEEWLELTAKTVGKKTLKKIERTHKEQKQAIKSLVSITQYLKDLKETLLITEQNQLPNCNVMDKETFDTFIQEL